MNTTCKPFKPQKPLKPKFKVGQKVIISNDGDKLWYTQIEFIECTPDDVRYALNGLAGMYPQDRLKTKVK